jgi:hypothetical protein
MCLAAEQQGPRQHQCCGSLVRQKSRPFRHVLSVVPKPLFQEACRSFHQLNKGRVLLAELLLGTNRPREPHTSAFVHGRKPATNSPFPPAASTCRQKA